MRTGNLRGLKGVRGTLLTGRNFGRTRGSCYSFVGELTRAAKLADKRLSERFAALLTRGGGKRWGVA